MIVQKDFLNKIKQFGINSYEAKIWAALLSRGISTAGELSDISNVPRSRSYDVLESLEKKGFIMVKIGKPIKYIAVHPSEVLERVKKKIKNDADAYITVIDKLKEDEIIKELELLHSKGVELVEPSDLSSSIKGRTNLYNHLEGMIRGAEKSVIIMTTENGLKRKADAMKTAMQKASKRGVEIKIIAHVTKNSENAAKELSKFAQIKSNKDINARFCLVDGKEIAFMLLDDTVDPSSDTAIWVNTPMFSKALETMFEAVWQQKELKVFN